MKLFLDDIRMPPDDTWVCARDIGVAKTLLEAGDVAFASLDHDLGACDACQQPDWHGVMPHCSHVGTGYDLCLWMAEHNIWPMQKPVVHSMNPVGRDRMRGVIDRYWSPR